MRWRWVAKNNPQDYWIERSFGAELRGLKNPIGDTHVTEFEKCSGTQEVELNAVYLLLYSS